MRMVQYSLILRSCRQESLLRLLIRPGIHLGKYLRLLNLKSVEHNHMNLLESLKSNEFRLVKMLILRNSPQSQGHTLLLVSYRFVDIQ